MLSSMLTFHRLWIYIFAVIAVANAVYIVDQQAPAKVTLRFSLTKFNHELNEFQFRLCIDKNKEKCFWTTNENVVLNDDSYKDIVYEFFISNMDTNLSISLKIENTDGAIQFSRKNMNLKKISSKDTFDFHSLTLENSIKMTIEHECVTNYYPPNQCTKFCGANPDEYSCDGFGNKICREGLYYNAKDEKCLPNNCIKSSIQCFNNGYCVNKGLTFECKCLESYIGKFCELPNPCFPNPCTNGKCFVNQTSNTHFCSCPAGYYGLKCESKSYKPCKCPVNMRCNYSASGILFSCTIEPVDELIIRPKHPEKNSDPVDRNSKSAKNIEHNTSTSWKNISLTTTIVAAVGCFMIILSITVSGYVCHRTRTYVATNKNRPVANSPSTHYTQFSPKFSESTFKRSLSFDDNGVYIQGTQSQLSNSPPGLLTLGSSNGYSINSNSYQENPAISFINYPTYSELCKQDPRAGYLILNRNCKESSNTDTVSSGSIPPPPPLPQRPTMFTSESPVLQHTEPE